MIAEKKSATVLIYESDANLSSVMGDYLRSVGYDVAVAANSDVAIERLSQQAIDLCLFESQMPDVSGEELTKEFRSRDYDMPIILLSERTEREEVLAGYEAGVDDYVAKPFVMDILLRKMKALLRLARRTEDNPETLFSVGGVTFDSARQTLGEQKLSARETELLLILCRNMNKLVDRSLILKRIWKTDDFFSARSLSVYIHHLRHFLGLEGSTASILVMHGKGYKLIEKSIVDIRSKPKGFNPTGFA
ncbi:MAG: response regulator transcription factor [Paludibacteraceae bacterium]|nr:response regulator transcription factor [Paludibacteraceae bacterium]